MGAKGLLRLRRSRPVARKNKPDIRLDVQKEDSNPGFVLNHYSSTSVQTKPLQSLRDCGGSVTKCLQKLKRPPEGGRFNFGGREGTRTPDLLRVNNLAVLRLRLFRHSRRSNQPKIAVFSDLSYPATQFCATHVNSCVLQCRSVLHSIDQC